MSNWSESYSFNNDDDCDGHEISWKNDDQDFSKEMKLKTVLDHEKESMVRNLIEKTKFWREYKELKFKKEDECPKNVLR